VTQLTLPHPGDSKSTSQELGDKSRSTADSAQDQGKGMFRSAQDTASNLGNEASQKGGDTQGTAKSYLQSAQNTASDYTQSAKDTTSDYSKKAQDNMPSQGEAQQSGKSYLETAQDMASNAAKTVSDTVSGKLCLFSSFESSLLIKPQALLVTSRDQAPAPPNEQFLMIPQRPVFFCLSERTRAVLSRKDLDGAMRMTVAWPGGKQRLWMVYVR